MCNSSFNTLDFTINTFVLRFIRKRNRLCLTKISTLTVLKETEVFRYLFFLQKAGERMNADNCNGRSYAGRIKMTY